MLPALVRRILILAITAAALAVVAVSAASEKRAVATSVTVSRQSNSSQVLGQVESARGFCVRDRPVALKRKIGDGATVEGRDRSDGEGRFEIEGAFVASNEYFVYAAAHTVTVRGQAHKCAAARSARFGLR